MTVMLEQQFDYDTAVEAFSFGDCWLLAKELHDLTGWDMYWAGSRIGDKYTSWCHIFVVDPFGNPVDVNGINDYEEFSKTWKKRAKMWKIINKPSSFTITKVEDYSKMVDGMRPFYVYGSVMVKDVAVKIVDDWKRMYE